ncbi:serine/threonine-protein kinase [Teredinibacter haidensis]|uniref:serine/threonine-protein kinase n=1 Tax=Teredinibacter haidensis TaxID=2731755 RepID=UPI000948E5A0|nr:serine/threonine-protein kinase [Teredinibacter haidensis]
MLAQKLLSKIANVNLRMWVLVIGLSLSLFPAQSSRWFQCVDQLLFGLSSYLVDAPKGGSHIGLVLVPDAELLQWQHDINSAGKLGALLSNILHSSSATVGLLLPGTIDLGDGEADGLLQQIAVSSTNSALIEQAEELVDRKQLLMDTLTSDRVVVATSGGVQAGQRPLAEQPGILNPVPGFVRNWLWPQNDVNLNGRESSLPRSSLEHYPLFPVNGNQRYLVMPGGNSVLYGDFLSYYLLAANGRSETKHLYWRADQGLTIGDSRFRTSPQGAFLTYNSASERLAPLLNSMSLKEGLARGAFPDYVLIAAKSSLEAHNTATAIYSLLNGNTAYLPWWQVVVSAGVTLLVTLMLVLVMARMSASSGLLSVALLLVLMLAAQLLMVVTRGAWLPMAAQGVWLLLGFLCIRIWVIKRQRWKQLQSRVDESGVVLAKTLLERGDLKEAVKALEDCSSSPSVLRSYYDLGNAYASKRQYQLAIDVFQGLVIRSRKFRDTEQKIKALEAVLGAPTYRSGKASSDVAATVVIDQQDIDRPVLGRYQIQRELGRGAMGTVYLGFDPKIARKVAIKTLTYSQFQPDQQENIKTRFFREAEAAGRLNHPHIVSVYDVGEEVDLAFIAMDYVEGKPLSAFVNENNLLPIFEVYRIMADVAAALEYAHGSNIVHRDIKPGNIMYCPSPYQVKVTDFGIARLVDDSKTSTGEILGSPLYMSPEQLKGKRVNHAADVFSLGVTFYQLLTGKLPFVGDNLASLTYEIIHGKHKGVRTLRKELPISASRITNQCLQKDAEDRYESAGELAQVVKKAIKRDFAHEAKQVGYL